MVGTLGCVEESIRCRYNKRLIAIAAPYAFDMGHKTHASQPRDSHAFWSASFKLTCLTAETRPGVSLSYAGLGRTLRRKGDLRQPAPAGRLHHRNDGLMCSDGVGADNNHAVFSRLGAFSQSCR